MSLYHETAAVLTAPSSDGGNLKTRIFGQKGLKSPPAQVYALALESCKWSSVLEEVIENAQILQHEKKLSPVLAVLLVHDFLLSKSGISLPASHGLRASIERHKARLTSEFTRARLRRKAASVEALKAQVEASCNPTPAHPRWVRINTLKSSLTEQLETTFAGFQRVDSIAEVLRAGGKCVHVDLHVPDLVAVSPSADLTKANAYKSGAIILQDKASCFPAYLLNPDPRDGDIIDSCAAPGNKTTHLAAILGSARNQAVQPQRQTVFAFEKDPVRARTLQKMVKAAGSDSFTRISAGQDFLRVNPDEALYRNVGALLLDPSCSGSGIVGRDFMPELHLPGRSPAPPGLGAGKQAAARAHKRKREEVDDKKVLVDDDGKTVTLTSEKDLEARLEALSSFQLTLLLHAFKFPAATKITYSTCSVHAQENEHVVLQALQSDIARRRGWRILRREDQVEGMRQWPVRGDSDVVDGNEEVADACIRAYKDDGRGVMGFFVAPFIRTKSEESNGEEAEAEAEAELGAPRETAKDGATPRKDKSSGRAALASGSSDGASSDGESEWAGFED